ncbi:RsmE family RNA methyltransferase [Helicobacter canis]|uniref:RsmE family RNA methyltransferase n=1 Tax=Helicobacter canis TaxID=29419 RepID=UPI0015F038B8|nr:RsmE family RNA methyltransferase [Helicobacter canis]
MARLERILVCSCEQCGRSDLCEIEILESTQAALECYPNALVLDFGGKIIGGDVLASSIALDSGVLIGAEGGFSHRERELFAKREIVAFDTGRILRSQTAGPCLACKMWHLGAW